MANTDTVADPTATSFFESLLELFDRRTIPSLPGAEHLLRRLALQAMWWVRGFQRRKTSLKSGYLNMLREFKQE
jgi:hypothetical protein